MTTYPDVLRTCNRLGILPPSEADFLAVYPVPVTNPAAGVIVLQEIPVISAESGAPIEDNVGVETAEGQIVWPARFLQQEVTEAAVAGAEAALVPFPEASQKKSRKKKDEF